MTIFSQCLSDVVIVGSGIKLHKQIIQSEQDMIKNPKVLEQGGRAAHQQT